jgi:hypothetical protein
VAELNSTFGNGKFSNGAGYWPSSDKRDLPNQPFSRRLTSPRAAGTAPYTTVTGASWPSTLLNQNIYQFTDNLSYCR